MLNEINHEAKVAYHLFYVSLKYTKTTDVILNLISRWESLLNKCMEFMLKKYKKNKKISEIPSTPKAKELAIRKLCKDELVQKIMGVYSLFHRLPELEKIREHEFRKNVAVIVLNYGIKIEINMEKLKEWNALIENFIKYINQIAKK